MPPAQFDYSQLSQILGGQYAVGSSANQQIQSLALQLQNELNRLRLINRGDGLPQAGQVGLIGQNTNNMSFGNLQIAPKQNNSRQIDQPGDNQAMQQKIEQIEREQQEYRQLKIGIEKKLQDIQNSLGNVGNIFDQSDQSTYQNPNSDNVNRECLDLKKNIKDTSPKSDFVGSKELKKKAMDGRVTKTE